METPLLVKNQFNSMRKIEQDTKVLNLRAVLKWFSSGNCSKVSCRAFSLKQRSQSICERHLEETFASAAKMTLKTDHFFQIWTSTCPTMERPTWTLKFCLHVCLCAGVGFPGTGATDSWNCHVGVGNWTQVLWKSQCTELRSHLSSPPLEF